MLPRNYKFTVQNATTQTIAANGVQLFARRWKRASDGSITYESSEATMIDNVSTLATSTYLDGSAQDNSTDKWEGGVFDFKVVAPASSNGPVILYFKRSTDSGTDFDDDALAIEIERISFTTSGTKRLSFQL